jgi:hypothetical protein
MAVSGMSSPSDEAVTFQRMGAGAVDALIGVGVGAVLGFLSAQLTERFRRQRRGRAAARLIWMELSRSEALAKESGEAGPGPAPLTPRFVFWESHADALAEVVPPDALVDLEIAYGSAEMLRDIAAGTTPGTLSPEKHRQGMEQLRAWIKQGKDAIEPYARKRSPLRRGLSLPEDRVIREESSDDDNDPDAS